MAQAKVPPKARLQPRALIDRIRHDFPDVDDPVAAIRSGRIIVDRVVRLNPAFRVRPGAHVALSPELALRGEAKLRPALERFGVTVEGKVALDLGASAGGFTRVLLEHGARRVYAVDAGHGQLLGSLRQDARVVNLESTNVGVLNAARVPDAVQVVTVDVSYLSLSAAVAQLDRIGVTDDADLVGLVKPMFELRLGRAPADAPGDDRLVEEALARATEGVARAGWRVVGWMPSPVRGAHGARELLLHARRSAEREQAPPGPGD
ncbi:MAG TPA: SAM-dependent methyltransferase [Chloroflexota bacterium]|nr:SAM-dependent methyltransferase [Chloroflexota bacterium]